MTTRPNQWAVCSCGNNPSSVWYPDQCCWKHLQSLDSGVIVPRKSVSGTCATTTVAESGLDARWEAWAAAAGRVCVRVRARVFCLCGSFWECHFESLSCSLSLYHHTSRECISASVLLTAQTLPSCYKTEVKKQKHSFNYFLWPVVSDPILFPRKTLYCFMFYLYSLAHYRPLMTPFPFPSCCNDKTAIF